MLKFLARSLPLWQHDMYLLIQFYWHISRLVEDCNKSMELLQSCIKPSNYRLINQLSSLIYNKNAYIPLVFGQKKSGES